MSAPSVEPAMTGACWLVNACHGRARTADAGFVSMNVSVTEPALSWTVTGVAPPTGATRSVYVWAAAAAARSTTAAPVTTKSDASRPLTGSRKATVTARTGSTASAPHVPANAEVSAATGAPGTGSCGFRSTPAR